MRASDGTGRGESRLARAEQPIVAGRLEGSIESHGEMLGQLYELEFTQLDGGEMRVEVDFMASPECVVYRESYQRATHVLGTLLPGKVAFALPLLDSDTVWWGNNNLARKKCPSSVSGELIDIRFGAGHSHLVAVLDQEVLQNALNKAQLSDSVVRSVQQGRRHPIIDFHAESRHHLAEVFQYHLDRAVSGNPLSEAQFGNLVLGGALSLFDHAEAAPMGLGAQRRLFLRAVELHDSLGRFPNVMTLCTELQVRPRTLQAAFQKVAGVGPLRFFMLRRLNEARRQLDRAHGLETTVKAVALGLGFTELGRFSVRYRQLFGESPSETLRRSPGRARHLPGVG